MFVDIIIGMNMKRLSFIAGAALVGMAAVSCGSRAEKIDGVETISRSGSLCSTEGVRCMDDNAVRHEFPDDADDGSICRQVSSVWRDRFPPL